MCRKERGTEYIPPKAAPSRALRTDDHMNAHGWADRFLVRTQRLRYPAVWKLSQCLEGSKAGYDCDFEPLQSKD